MTYLATSARSSVPNATREIRALRKAPSALYSRQRGNSRSANRRSYSAACSARMWMTMTSSSLMTLLPSSDRAFQSQVATRDGTQNTLVWIDARLHGLHLTATHSGGFARKRLAIVTTLCDQLVNACAGSCQPCARASGPPIGSRPGLRPGLQYLSC